MTDFFVGLGSNLGDRGAHLRFALSRMRSETDWRLLSVSRFRETAPVGGPEQPDYLNAVARLESPQQPQAVLQRLLAFERLRGRSRSVYHGPRTLDLDLLLFGCAELRSPFLTVPHPRITERAFVLEPLAELAPRFSLPDGRRPSECLQSLRSD